MELDKELIKKIRKNPDDPENQNLIKILDFEHTMNKLLYLETASTYLPPTKDYLKMVGVDPKVWTEYKELGEKNFRNKYLRKLKIKKLWN